MPPIRRQSAGGYSGREGQRQGLVGCLPHPSEPPKLGRIVERLDLDAAGRRYGSDSPARRQGAPLPRPQSRLRRTTPRSGSPPFLVENRSETKLPGNVEQAFVDPSTFTGKALSVARRASWKSYLKLSLVSCPVTLYPVTSDRTRGCRRTCSTRSRTSSRPRRAHSSRISSTIATRTRSRI